MHFSAIATCTLIAGAFAAPALQTKRHVVHERRDQLPRRWERDSKLNGDSHLPMRFGLSQSNLHRANEFLMDVADPSSSNFGKHWSPKKVAETFAPSKDAVTAVMEWLTDAGIARERVKQSQGLNWIEVNATVTEAENLLQTEYWQYVHPESGTTHVACEDYQVPADIRKHIDIITPTIHFDAKVVEKKKKRSMTAEQERVVKRSPPVTAGTGKSVGAPGAASLPKKVGGPITQALNLTSELADCDESITPDCLRALYGIPTNYTVAPGNSYGVVEYTPQSYLPDDLDLFFETFAPELIGERPIFDSIDGGVLQTIVESFAYNGESDLDIEYAMALIYPQALTLFQTGDLEQGASFNNFLDAIDGSFCTYEGGDDPTQDGIYPDPYGTGEGYYEGPENCGKTSPTSVISTSYGYDEYQLTPFYEERQCYEYMKLGLQGITILYSSGDYGVAGNDVCLDPVTGNATDGTYGLFVPTFPGGCPYVTSVGATQVDPNATVTDPESAANYVIYSGGGFSNVFAAPSYQSDALAAYYADYLPPYTSDQYNTSQTSRGFPDVSANGVNYVIAVDGELSYVYGTSASSPTFGAVITLVNAARLEAGKSPVGFINPVLYANPSILNDITSGDNPGCGTDGFSAVPGWDPVTGLGTPNFPKMVELWLSLP